MNYTHNFMIYCTYHDEKLIKEYNLDYIPNYIKLFNAKDTSIHNDNINFLNCYLNELCTIYYVWKNKIYLNYDYVGFCHYRRFFNKIDFDFIDKNNAYAYTVITVNREEYFNQFYNFYKLYDKLYEYICSLNLFNKDYLYDYFYKCDNIKIAMCESYIFKCKFFDYFCNISFGFIKYIMGDTWENTDIFKNVDNEYFKYYECEDRTIGINFEQIFGIILCLINNNDEFLNNYNRNYIIHILSNKRYNDNYNEDNNLIIWYKKNSKIGDCCIYNNDKLYMIKLSYWHNYQKFVLNEYDDMINEKNIFKINSNEYIKSLDPINFLNNNYSIEKI